MKCFVKGIIAVSVIIAIFVAIIAVVSQCFIKLETSEVAITYNTYTKYLNPEPFYEGLHIGAPTLTFIKFPSIFSTLSYSGKKCLNKDGVTVTLSISLQYKIRPSKIIDIISQFRDETGYIKILDQVGSTAVLDVCCLFNTTQLQAERGRFQALLAETLTNKFDALHTDVTEVQVTNIIRPWKYEQAIKNKELAREDIQVARNERPQRLTLAITKKRTAGSEADIILDGAASEAKIMINRAKAEGRAILNEYTKEAASYKQLKLANGLDNKGFLAYMGIRAIANSKNPVHVGMKAPAITNTLS